MSKHSTPAQYVILLIDLVVSQGGDSAVLFENTSYSSPDIDELGARVSESDFIQMLTNAQQITQDSALGLHFGQRLNLSSHAILGQAFMTCETLGSVFDLFMKYYHILSPSLDVNYYRQNGRCYLEPGNNGSMPDYFGYELFFAAVENTVSALLGVSQLGFYYEFNYPPPEYVSEYREVLGEVQFKCDVARMSFDEKMLNLRLPSSNPALLALYEKECSRLLADIESEDTVAEQTLRLLRRLEGHYPQMEQLARLINMSSRSYRRVLAQEGYTFQQLLDQIRAEHATHYLTHTNLPLFSIALNVGFNDASNFRRAYKKWVGKAPQQVRDEYQKGA